jgi:hypothetical protein
LTEDTVELAREALLANNSSRGRSSASSSSTSSNSRGDDDDNDDSGGGQQVQLAASPIVSLVGVFEGMTSAQVFSWAFERYANVTSKQRLVMLGGECGNSYKHGVADYGVATNSFFMELNTDPDSTADGAIEEYELAATIMAQQANFSLLFGWHSYCKDSERTYTTLASQNTLRVEGLSTLPNFSFMTKKSLDPSFVFANNHNELKPDVRPPHSPIPPKTYIACVQTDSLGLGSWLSPNRGTIPYAWETPLNYVWLAPVILEFYYGSATPNDLMIGAISGPGYNYPKAIPPANLPQLLALAHNYTNLLDISVMETMDDTDGDLIHGNADLTQKVVQTYFDSFPDFTGFVHGYGPASTFAENSGSGSGSSSSSSSSGGDRDPHKKEKQEQEQEQQQQEDLQEVAEIEEASPQAFVSFDYYLSEYSTEAEATSDLEELAALNRDPSVPYFLLVHVREFSDISKVVDVLDALPAKEFEVLPLDSFLTLAGRAPTFEEHFAPY